MSPLAKGEPKAKVKSAPAKQKVPAKAKVPSVQTALLSPLRSRERILSFGIGGSGKSYDGLCIARASVGVTIWCIDNDNAYERLLETEFDDLGIRESYKGWEEKKYKTAKQKSEDPDPWGGAMPEEGLPADPNGRVVLFNCRGWTQQAWAFQYAVDHAAPNDWILYDSVSAPWEDVQSWFVQETFGSSIDKYFMEVRMAAEKAGGDKKALGALEGWTDWPAINAVYRERIRQHVKYPPCHLYLTAELDAIGKDDKTDKAVAALFGRRGVKPRGQKRLGHDVQTVLWKEQKRNGDWVVTTVKDRGGREDLESTVVEDFAVNYLEDVAGFEWKAVA